jgi:hypothetical protein
MQRIIDEVDGEQETPGPELGTVAAGV